MLFSDIRAFSISNEHVQGVEILVSSRSIFGLRSLHVAPRRELRCTASDRVSRIFEKLVETILSFRKRLQLANFLGFSIKRCINTFYEIIDSRSERVRNCL